MKSGISSDSAFYALCRKQQIKATRLKEHHFIVSQLPYYEGQEWDAKETDRGIEVTIHPRGIETIKVPTWYNSFLSWANKFGIAVKYRTSHIGYSEDFGFADLGKHGWTLVTTAEWPKGVELPAFVKHPEGDENYYILLKNGRQESFKVLRQKRERMVRLIEGDILRYLTLIDEYEHVMTAERDTRKRDECKSKLTRAKESLQESIREWCDTLGFFYHKIDLKLNTEKTVHELLMEEEWKWKRHAR